MYDRVLQYPDRVRNLYFTFLFVLHVIAKAENDTGNCEEDIKAQSLMRQLLYNQKLQAACPVLFDEAKLWKGQSRPELKQQIQKQFRNIRDLSLNSLFGAIVEAVNNSLNYIFLRKNNLDETIPVWMNASS
ncbi:Endoplasmic reticulum oxidoreductin-1 [Capsicum chinense]|nr:Endoplasmic reticulum oxidoreductin-1 [Capsicum chinense]